MPSSPSRKLRPESREPARQGAPSTVKGGENAEQRRPRTAPKGTKHQPQLRPAAACRPARLPCDPPTRAAPPQRHGRRHMTAARTAAAAQERRRAPDAMLRRQLSHEPYPSAPPPCARAPSGQDAQPSAESADGSQLAAPPLQRGAPQRHHRWFCRSFHQSFRWPEGLDWGICMGDSIDAGATRSQNPVRWVWFLFSSSVRGPISNFCF